MFLILQEVGLLWPIFSQTFFFSLVNMFMRSRQAGFSNRR